MTSPAGLFIGLLFNFTPDARVPPFRGLDVRALAGEKERVQVKLFDIQNVPT
jgi:hypothetical protein